MHQPDTKANFCTSGSSSKPLPLSSGSCVPPTPKLLPQIGTSSSFPNSELIYSAFHPLRAILSANIYTKPAAWQPCSLEWCNPNAWLTGKYVWPAGQCVCEIVPSQNEFGTTMGRSEGAVQAAVLLLRHRASPARNVWLLSALLSLSKSGQVIMSSHRSRL